MFDAQPTLTGELVHARPLRAADFDGLYAVAADPLLWAQHPQQDRHQQDVFRRFFLDALSSGGALAVVDGRDHRIIGTSRYHGHDAQRREIEIGWTFLAPLPLGRRPQRGAQAPDAPMLAASDLVFAVVERSTDRLVGFARVLTDGVYLACVLDVIVASRARGSGVGRVLLDAIVDHPRLAGVRSVELACQPELMPFYRRWGFTGRVGRSRLMRRSSDPLPAPSPPRSHDHR